MILEFQVLIPSFELFQLTITKFPQTIEKQVIPIQPNPIQLPCQKNLPSPMPINYSSKKAFEPEEK